MALLICSGHSVNLSDSLMRPNKVKSKTNEDVNILQK